MTGHASHFLQRLDRLEDRAHLELAYGGLYQDPELVRFILASVRLPEGADRVALALDDGGEGPHVIVTRDGKFVTVLGTGMSPRPSPIVSRAHFDALADKAERVRDGIAIARKRGFDAMQLVSRLETVGPALPREDFLAASALLAPVTSLLIGTYTGWASAFEEIAPLLQSARGWDAAKRRESESNLARGAWAMAHATTILIDTLPRRQVSAWADVSESLGGSPWRPLVALSAFPFVLRAAWLAGRLGKPLFPAYREAFLKASDPMGVHEGGWGLACMAMRHESLHAQALKALRSPPPGSQESPSASQYGLFAEVASAVERKAEALHAEAIDVGRKHVVLRTSDLPEASPHRYTEASSVPDELALPAFFDLWLDANNGERAADLMIVGVATAARARAEDFYYPATFLHAVGADPLDEMGRSLVEMRGVLTGKPKPVRRNATPGRNDPCSCGSGKKFKKCHGR